MAKILGPCTRLTSGTQLSDIPADIAGMAIAEEVVVERDNQQVCRRANLR